MPDQSLSDQLALMTFAKSLSTAAHAQQAETTPLNPEDEQAFQQWATDNHITDVDAPDSHYDLRGYWKNIASQGQDETQVNPDDGRVHYPDTYKQHGHPTFSQESQYSQGPADGGQWLGDQLIAPPEPSHGPETGISVTTPPAPTFSLSTSMRRRSPTETNTTPTPLPSHVNAPGGFVRAMTPTEVADNRTRERMTLPWNQTDYTTPMRTIPQLGGLRIPAGGEGYFDPTAVMTTDVPGGGGLLERILPEIKRPIHPMGLISLINGRGAAEEAETRGMIRWLQRKGNTKVSGSDVAAYLNAHPIAAPRSVVVTRAGIGAGIGAGAGATADPEHPMRGALAGAALGGTIGGLSGRAAAAEARTSQMSTKLAAAEARAKAAASRAEPVVARDTGVMPPPAPASQEEDDLIAKWADINNLAQAFVDAPDSHEAGWLLDQMNHVSRKQHEAALNRPMLYDTLPSTVHDVIIIGAGPAGLMAAINARAEGMRAVILEASHAVGGQSGFSTRIENIYGFPLGSRGRALATKAAQTAERFGAEIRLNTRVTGLHHDPGTGIKTLTLQDGSTIQSRAVILATGREFTRPAFEGASAKGVVLGDPHALAALAKQGQDLVFTGGGNSVAQAIVGLADTKSPMTLVVRKPLLAKNGVSKWQINQLRSLEKSGKLKIIENDEIARIVTNQAGHATGVETKLGRHLPAHGVGIFTGSRPMTDWLPPEIRRRAEGTGKGLIEVGPNLETGIPGVFATGDTRVGSRPRVAFAGADGQFAADSVWHYFERLNPPEK